MTVWTFAVPAFGLFILTAKPYALVRLLPDLLTAACLIVVLIGSYLLYGWKKYQSVKK
ncbi:hypothetical protein [Listeria costaricensis]|uniref:hypothetical protein n=1 Tax=Listeria costaricensis TaxID=2026604 RepID=UPI0013C51EB1|nr:hypothetical protein [Listeria costaricensis]